MDQLMSLFNKKQPKEINRPQNQLNKFHSQYQGQPQGEAPYNYNRNKYNFNQIAYTPPTQIPYNQNEINHGPPRNKSPMQYDGEKQGRASRIKNNLMQFANQAPYQNTITNPVPKSNFNNANKEYNKPNTFPNQRYQTSMMDIEQPSHYGYDDSSDYLQERAFIDEINNKNQYFAPKEKRKKSIPSKMTQEISKDKKQFKQAMTKGIEQEALPHPNKGRLGKEKQVNPKVKPRLKTKQLAINKESKYDFNNNDVIYQESNEEQSQDDYDKDPNTVDIDNNNNNNNKQQSSKEEPTKKNVIDLSKFYEQQKNKKRSASPITQSYPKQEITATATDLSNRQSLCKDDQSSISSIPKAQLHFMCSDYEIIERESQNLLSIFELDSSRCSIDPLTNIESKKAKPEYAIKAYFRPGGDLNKYDPQNIRTPKVLKQTIDYILNNIVDSDKIPNPNYSQLNMISFSEICLFVNDRFRAIRQDFTIQELKGNKECIQSNEYIARFLILCLNETLDIKSISGEQGLYNLNMTQLNSTLTSLKEFYEYSHKEKLKDPNADVFISPDEEEFLSYFILIALKQKPIEFMSIISKIPKKMQKGPYISQALNIAKNILSNDWNSFMKILKSKECNYLTSCLMVLFFTDIRFRALTELSCITKPLCAAYLISIDQLCRKLPFEDPSECIKFLEWFGIEISYSNVDNTSELFPLIKGNNTNDLNFIYAPMKTNHQYIQIKKGAMTRKEIILGKHADHNSINCKTFFKQQLEEFKRPSSPKIKNSFDKIKQSQQFKHIDFQEPKPSTSNVDKIVLDSKKIEQKISSPFIKKDSTSKCINIIEEQASPLIINDSKDDALFYSRIAYFIAKCDIISKIFTINHKLFFLSNMRIIQEQYRIIYKFQRQQAKQRKHQIFSAWRKAHIKIKYNTLYIKEMIKYNINISSIEKNYSMIPKTQFAMYNFDELQYFLIQSYETNNGQLIKKDENYYDNNDCSLIHLQVNFYTTKALMENTQILQNLHVDSRNIQLTNEEIMISSKVNNNTKTYWIFLRFIFLDQIASSSIDNYIYLNQQNLSKFAYGVIFFDYTNEEVIKTFITLLDQSLGKYIKKKFIFGFEITNTLTPEHFNSLHESYLSLANRYQYNEYINNSQSKTIFLGNLTSFSSYFTDLLIFHNNSTFISLFKDNSMLSLQSFNSNITSISLSKVNKQLRYDYFIREMKSIYPFSTNNFLIEETLLSISIIKIISLFYKTKMANELNEMLNIPLFLTSNVMSRNETIYLKIIQFFDCITLIDLVNIANYMHSTPKCYIESPLAYFDVLVRTLRDFDFDTGIDYRIYRDAIIKYEYNTKKQFALSIDKGMMNYVILFYNEVIDFISDSLDFEINWTIEDRAILEEMFIEIKEKALKEVQESVINLVMNDLITEVKLNEMLSKEDQPILMNDFYDNYSFLNKKRARFENNEYSKQFTIEFLQNDSNNQNKYKSLSYPYLNYYQRAEFNLKPSLVSYISQ